MKTLADPDAVLTEGLAAIRAQFKLPAGFDPAVLRQAEAAARRPLTDHVDRTDVPFVTLDPASSTDLDQAFAIERAGGDLLLRYAIADVARFVGDGDAVDGEAWGRGTSQYLPDGKVSLYPPVLSEGAASLLPDGPRPAIVFAVRVGSDGAVRLDGVERAVIRSRAKLAYDSVRDDELPKNFIELAHRIQAAEVARGAGRVNPPEQELASLGGGRYRLQFRSLLVSEERNAAMSLATNMAVADALFAHKAGLFRIMAGPDERAISRLRFTAKALGIVWDKGAALTDLQKALDPDKPNDAAFMAAIRRAGRGATYAPYRDGVRPWHAAMAATYVHATAPLRRLADRYVIQAAYAVANGQAVPERVSAAFEQLPKVMERAENLGGQIDRAVIDLAEAVVLSGSERTVFDAVVTDIDERGARFQLRDLPVTARVAADHLTPGEAISVRLVAVDIATRSAKFAI